MLLLVGLHELAPLRNQVAAGRTGADHGCVHDLGLPARQRARLIQDHTLQLRADLKRRSAARDEDAVLCGYTSRGHHRRRRRQAKGARAGDEEHREAMLQHEEEPVQLRPVADAALQDLSEGHQVGAVDDPIPDGPGHDRQRDHEGHEAVRNGVGHLLHRGPGELRALHQRGDLAQHRLRAQALNLHLHPATHALGAADDEVPLLLRHRPRLAGQQRLVERGDHRALVARLGRGGHAPVRRRRLAREDLEDVPELHKVHGDLLGLGLATLAAVVRQEVGLGQLQCQQCAQRGGGLPLRPGLNGLADKNERDDHARRLEVGWRRGLARVAEADFWAEDQEDHHREGVHEREERTQRDEHIHVPDARLQGVVRADVEALRADDLHRRGQDAHEEGHYRQSWHDLPGEQVEAVRDARQHPADGDDGPGEADRGEEGLGAVDAGPAVGRGAGGLPGGVQGDLVATGF
mmetsp:Transcript_20673/g.57109  ORF Transcript_20673/g.57109 Transcript_20673/m.57109 type:complete len:463 (-) Transcript_20673:680-2068(-)